VRRNPATIAKVWGASVASNTQAQEEANSFKESPIVSFRRALRMTVRCEIGQLLRCARRRYGKEAASDSDVLSKDAII